MMTENPIRAKQRHAAKVRNAINNGHYFAAAADGQRYMFGWDEECTAICMWPEDAGEYDPAIATFGDDTMDAAMEIVDFLTDGAK